MAIKPRPALDALDEAIRGAPDAAPGASEQALDEEDRKRQVPLYIMKSRLDELDERARRNGLTRNALVNLYIQQGMDRGEL